MYIPSRNYSVKPVRVIELNCENPSESDLAFLLEHLPKKVNAQGFLKLRKGHQLIDFTQDEVLKGFVSLTTSEELVLRKSKKHQDQWRLAVIDSKQFGDSGLFSIVRMNAKTFRYKADVIATTEKRRVYKELTPDSARKYDLGYVYCDNRVGASMQREETILKQLPYLKSSPIYKDESGYFTIYSHFEALLPGEVLRNYLEPRYFVIEPNGKRYISRSERKAIEASKRVSFRAVACVMKDVLSMITTLSMDERIQLCVALLEALMVVTSAGILHKDIKPANIIISRTQDGFQAYIIDVNLSKLASENEQNLSLDGSPLYFSPEVLDLSANHLKSDVFSLGIVLAECFGATLNHFQSLRQVVRSLRDPYVFVNLFRDVNDASDEQKVIITSLLTLMVEHDLAKRLSVEEALKAFRELANKMVPECLMQEGAPLALPPGLQIPQTLFSQPKAMDQAVESLEEMTSDNTTKKMQA